MIKLQLYILTACSSRCVHATQASEDIFIDGSTGRCYPIASSPFLGVESIWNHTNYWVCMQMPEPHSDSRATPQQLSLDLTDSSKWEYLLPSAAPQVTIHLVVWKQCVRHPTARYRTAGRVPLLPLAFFQLVPSAFCPLAPLPVLQHKPSYCS